MQSISTHMHTFKYSITVHSLGAQEEKYGDANILNNNFVKDYATFKASPSMADIEVLGSPRYKPPTAGGSYVYTREQFSFSAFSHEMTYLWI